MFRREPLAKDWTFDKYCQSCFGTGATNTVIHRYKTALAIISDFPPLPDGLQTLVRKLKNQQNFKNPLQETSLVHIRINIMLSPRGKSLLLKQVQNVSETKKTTRRKVGMKNNMTMMMKNKATIKKKVMTNTKQKKKRLSSRPCKYDD